MAEETEKLVSRRKFERAKSLNNVKVLSNEAKTLLVDTEAKFKGKCCLLSEDETKVLTEGFTYNGKPQNQRSSFLYAIARVLSVIGYAKREVGANKTLIEDIKRVSFDGKQLGLNLTNKDKPID